MATKDNKIQDQIYDAAVEILAGEPQGLRFTPLTKAVEGKLPGAKHNTVVGAIGRLADGRAVDVFKPAFGVYIHTKFKTASTEAELALADDISAPQGPREHEFYETFAVWMKDDLGECTSAIPVGHNKFGDKWGTPDVLAIREPKKSDVIQFPIEVIAVEVKLSPREPLTAFAQACCYGIFAHKCYVVVPSGSGAADITRLDALCRIFGIGLVLFDSDSPKDPKYDIRVRATRHEPDMFYTNHYVKLVEDELL